MYIPLPDQPACIRIINAILRKAPVSPLVDRNLLAEKTNRFSGADLTGICSRAVRFAVNGAITAEEAERQKMDPEHPNHIVEYGTPEDYDPHTVRTRWRRTPPCRSEGCFYVVTTQQPRDLVCCRLICLKYSFTDGAQ